MWQNKNLQIIFNFIHNHPYIYIFKLEFMSPRLCELFPDQNYLISPKMNNNECKLLCLPKKSILFCYYKRTKYVLNFFVLNCTLKITKGPRILSRNQDVFKMCFIRTVF